MNLFSWGVRGAESPANAGGGVRGGRRPPRPGREPRSIDSKEAPIRSSYYSFLLYLPIESSYSLGLARGSSWAKGHLGAGLGRRHLLENLPRPPFPWPDPRGGFGRVTGRPPANEGLPRGPGD